MESTLKKRSRNERRNVEQTFSLYKNAVGGLCVCVYSRCLSSKTMRDPFWSSAILLYRSRSLISDTRLHPTVGQQIKIHFFPSRSQEVHASTIKSTFPSSPPPLEELVVPFHWIRDVRSRSNDGINHTNNRIFRFSIYVSNLFKISPLIEIHLAQKYRGAG